MKLYFQVCRKKLRRTVASPIRMNQFRGREAGIGCPPFKWKFPPNPNWSIWNIRRRETKSLVELAKHSPIMSDVTNVSKSEAVRTGKQISEISVRKFGCFNFFRNIRDKKCSPPTPPNAANLAADGLNLNSWLSAFYPVPNLRLQIQQETFFEK